MFDINKYAFYTYTDANGAHIVVAVSTYAGKVVKGRAKCDPRDKYDFKKGKELAAARCNARVANKRAKRAQAKLSEAIAAYSAAQAKVDKMNSYVVDSNAAAIEANEYVKELVSKL